VARRRSIFRLRDWLISRQRYWETDPVVYCDDCGWCRCRCPTCRSSCRLDASSHRTGQSPLTTHEGSCERLAHGGRPGTARDRHEWTPSSIHPGIGSAITSPHDEGGRLELDKAALWCPVDLTAAGSSMRSASALCPFFTKVLRELRIGRTWRTLPATSQPGMILARKDQDEQSRGTRCAG